MAYAQTWEAYVERRRASNASLSTPTQSPRATHPRFKRRAASSQARPGKPPLQPFLTLPRWINLEAAFKAFSGEATHPSDTIAQASSDAWQQVMRDREMSRLRDVPQEVLQRVDHGGEVVTAPLGMGHEGIARIITEAAHRTRCFQMLDLHRVVSNHLQWRKNLPRVQPGFRVSDNRDEVLLGLLASLGVDLICSSVADVKAAALACIRQGVVPKTRLADSHPCRPDSLIAASRSAGVSVFVVDSVEEVERLAQVLGGDGAWEASLVIQITLPQTRPVKATVPATGFGSLSILWGAELSELPAIIKASIRCNMNVSGFMFDVSDIPENLSAKESSMHQLREAWDMSHQKPSQSSKQQAVRIQLQGLHTLDSASSTLLQSIRSVFPIDEGFVICADATENMAAGAFSLVSCIIGRKGPMYYIDDGCYGSFGRAFLDAEAGILPTAIRQLSPDNHPKPSTLWGPTCDGLDCVVKVTSLPELDVGDWLLFPELGLHTSVHTTNFNGAVMQQAGRLLKLGNARSQALDLDSGVT
ncbi:unnamed protein product [Chrysoparadoxa australica]